MTGYPNGVYRLDYETEDEGRPRILSALVALSGNRLLGSDPYGALLQGEIGEPEPSGRRRLSLRIGVPPGGELVTGFAGGEAGGTVAVEAELPEYGCGAVVVAEVAGQPLAVTLNYVGPLPCTAPSQRRNRSHERAAPHTPRDHHRSPRHPR